MAAALVGSALAGCTTSGDKASEFDIKEFSESQQRDFLKSLTELRAIPGVRDVSWVATPNSFWESYATIEVGVSEAFAADQLSAITATMKRYDRGGRGPGLPVSFSIRFVGDDDAGFMVSGHGFSRDDIVQNYRFWREVTAVMGLEMKMHLQMTSPDRDDYMRVISAPADTHPLQPLRHMIDHYDGIAALSSPEGKPADALSVDGTGVFEFWSIPGMQSSGSLPPREVLDLAERLSSFFPLRANEWLTAQPDDDTDFPTGVSVRWDDDAVMQQGRHVQILARDYQEKDWPAIVAAAAASSQLAGFNFQYYASDRDFFFHTSTCEGSVQNTADDQALVDAVRASGVTLLEGAAPGQCMPDF